MEHRDRSEDDIQTANPYRERRALTIQQEEFDGNKNSIDDGDQDVSCAGSIKVWSSSI